MSEQTIGRVMCCDCRHVWAARYSCEAPAVCPRCGSLSTMESDTPWQWVPATAMLYLRACLAGHSYPEIAEHHHTTVSGVKLALFRSCAEIRRHCPFYVRNARDLVIVAAYAHIPPLLLRETVVTQSRVAVAEPEPAGVGCG